MKKFFFKSINVTIFIQNPFFANIFWLGFKKDKSEKIRGKKKKESYFGFINLNEEI